MLEITACGVLDGDADGRTVVVDVIRRGLEIDAALGLAGFNGNGLAVGQGHCHRRLGRIAQGHGVGDHAAFGDRRARRQGRGGGIDRVVDRGLSRRRVRGQLFEVAASGVLDGDADGRTVVVDVIRRGLEIDAALGLAGFNGNGLAVGQGHCHRRLGRIAQGHGVGDHAAFGDRRARRQGRGGGIDRVVDRGLSRRRIRGQLLEITAGGVLDGDTDSRTVVVDVIRRGLEIDAALGFAGFNGNGLAVGQGHCHRRLGRIAQGHGVSDHAAFGDRRARRQGRGSGVDRVVDRGLSRRRVRGQLLEITARGVLDGDADRRTVVVDVIGRGLEIDAALGFTRFNGNRLAVGQGHSYRRLGRIAQGHGVGDHAAFGDRRARRQGRGGGVDRVVDRGLSRRRVRGQLFEVAASGALDGDADGRAVVVDVIGRGLEIDAALGFTRFNGNRLAVGQVHGYRRLGRVAQGHGVSDHAAFGDRRARRQGRGSGVDRVVDRGLSRGRIRGQLLEITACGVLDGDADGRTVVVDVIRRGLEIDAALGLAGFNGNGLAVGQGHCHRRLGRIAQGHGVGDYAAFGDRRARRQGRGGGIDRVVDRGLSRGRVRGQLLEITACGVLDGDADSRTVVVDVIRRGLEVDAALGFAGFNGNRLAVGQGHGHRRLGRVAQGHGVSDHAAFGDRRARRQGRGGGIDRVVDRGLSRGRIRGQLLEITACGVLDGDADGRTVVVDVIRRGLEIDAALGLAGFNGNGLAVGQGHGYRRLGRIAQDHGVGDHAAFGDRRARRQGRGGGIDRVVDRGLSRRRVRGQLFEVAAGGVLDGDADGRTVVVDVIGRGLEIDAALGFAGFNSDDLAVGQGHGYRRLGRIAQGHGVGDYAAFGDRRARRQGRGGGIDRVVDRGLSRGRIRGQLLEITACGVLDGDADGRTVVVDVIRRGLEIDAALGLAGFNGNGLAVGQGHCHRRLGRIAQGHGVSDHAAFGDRRARRQGRGSGVDRVVDRGLSRRRVRGQLLEITARGVLDGDADRRTVVVDVIGRGLEIDAALGFTRFNGNRLAVGQGHSYRRLGRIAQGHGVGDHAAFGDRRARRQGRGGGVDRVVDRGLSRRRVRGQLFEVAASGALDGDADGRAVVVDVIGRGLEIDAALGFTRFNGNRLAVGQVHGYRRLGRVAQGHGVSDHAAFGDRRARRQGRGGGVDRVVDRGLSRGRIRGQLLEITAGGVLDGDADGRTVVVDVIGRGLEIDAALGFAGFNSDDLAVGQGHGHRRLGRVAQGHGVGDHATFGHAWRGGQGRGCSVDCIGHLGNRWRLRQCHRQPATTGTTCHGGRNLATVDVRCVVCRNCDVDATTGLPSRNDDHGTIGQSNYQVGGRRLTNGGGINDYATRFTDRRGCAKRQLSSDGGIRRCGHQVVAVSVQQAHFLVIGYARKAQPVSREANRRVNSASRLFEHHEAVATAQRTTTR
ncbi:Uncharacterised protein [Pseudomonas putida]|nr:Uncharacterised protein [Pseudomonas putida]